jgi:multiple sugar transport system substrate-binding protein
MKKLLALVVVALLVCGSAQEEVTLLFWPGPESDAMQKVVDAYNTGPGATDGVTVKQLLFSRQGYFDKELADLAAGSSEFDLALVTTYTLGKYAPYLEPLDAYFTGTAAQTPASLESLKFDGKQFGVPTDVSLHFMYYRQDLVDQLLSDEAWQGVYGDISEKMMGSRMTPKAPAEWTWDDYIATALFFTKSLNPESPTTYGSVLELKNLIFNIMIWQSTMVSNGGNWLDADGNVTINSEAAKRGLEIYQAIIDNGATPPDSISYEYAEANEAFRSGQSATMLQWNAAFNELNNPELSPLVAGKIGIAPLPAGSDGNKTHVHALGIGLNAASTKKEAAGKFATYLFSEAAMPIYGEAGGNPPVPSVLAALSSTRPDFVNLSEYLEKYAYVVNGGTAAYAVPIYEVLAEEFSAVWAGQKEIDAALESAATRMAEKMNE